MTIRSAPVAALVLLCACSGASAEDRTAALEPNPAQRDSVVRKANVRTLGPPGSTLFDSITIDVDGDETAERVELGVDAGRDERGAMNWDDQHTWFVVVRDGPDSYPLLREFGVGAAAFWVVQEDSTGPAAILVQTSTLTTSIGGTRLDRFVWDGSRGGYVRTGRVGGMGRRAFYRGPQEPTRLLPATWWRGDP